MGCKEVTLAKEVRLRIREIARLDAGIEALYNAQSLAFVAGNEGST